MPFCANVPDAIVSAPTPVSTRPGAFVNDVPPTDSVFPAATEIVPVLEWVAPVTG